MRLVEFQGFQADVEDGRKSPVFINADCIILIAEVKHAPSGKTGTRIILPDEQCADVCGTPEEVAAKLTVH